MELIVLLFVIVGIFIVVAQARGGGRRIQPMPEEMKRQETPPGQSREEWEAEIERYAHDAISRRDANALRLALGQASAHGLSTYGWSRNGSAWDLPDLFDLQARIEQHAATWPRDEVFFEIAAGTSKGGADDGRLLMTPEGFTFIGDTRREMAWEDVYHLATGDADFRRDDTVWYLAVQRHGRQSSSKFWFSNSAAAQQAYLVAEAFVRGVSPSSARAVPDPFTTDVVGESYRQDALVALAPTLGSDREFVAALVPEPTNPHDGNAVKVCIAATDEHVGYLSRVLASRLHDRITERHREAPVHVRARLTGGGINTPTHGVQLDLGNLMEPSDAALNEE